MVQSSEDCLVTHGVIVDEIRLLIELLQVKYLNYVLKDCNKVAHNLAGAAISKNLGSF